MRVLSAFISLLAVAPYAALAGPVRYEKRSADNANNILVLQFAAVLEQLESQFYSEGLKKFSDTDFQSAGFSSINVVSEQLGTIQGDEAAHLAFLEKALAALGSAAPSTCTFNFDSALTDVPTMAATARVVEQVGVGAYMGAANLITDPQILTAAASILTIEARHQSMLNLLSGVGGAIPQAFDIALTPSEVLAIAGPFISGCDLGVPANKPVSLTNTGLVTIGTELTFNFDGIPADISSLSCQMLVGGAVNTISLPLDKCVVPVGVNGPVAIFITSDSQPLPNNVILRGSANNLVAGPTLAFIDATVSPLSQIVRVTDSGAAAANSSSTSSDISPAQASQIAEAGSAGATLSPGGATAPGAADVSGLPNLAQGASAGGAVIVDGWQNLPIGGA